MIEEVRIFGVYMPAPLVWAVVSLSITYWIRGWLHRQPIYTQMWQQGLMELGLFVLLWWSVARVADAWLPPGLVS